MYHYNSWTLSVANTKALISWAVTAFVFTYNEKFSHVHLSVLRFICNHGPKNIGHIDFSL